jgi:hypothetical protein
MAAKLENANAVVISRRIPAIGEVVIRLSSYPHPVFTAVLIGQKVRRFDAGIESAVRLWRRRLCLGFDAEPVLFPERCNCR